MLCQKQKCQDIFNLLKPMIFVVEKQSMVLALGNLWYLVHVYFLFVSKFDLAPG